MPSRSFHRRFRAAAALASLVVAVLLFGPGGASAEGGVSRGVGVELGFRGAATASTNAAFRAASSGATAPVAYAHPYRYGPRTRRVVALTFDDGYSPPATLAIFRILVAEHVKATFFPYAKAILEAPAIWRQIAVAGYPIGNHTWSHGNLTHLSAAGVITELTRARATVRSITGRSEPAIMRPPYGAYTTATRSASALAGYPTLALWDVDTRDWSGISPSSIVARAVVGRPGSIVLMHAGPANTPKPLRAIIENYRARGYSFVTLPELLGVAWP